MDSNARKDYIYFQNNNFPIRVYNNTILSETQQNILRLPTWHQELELKYITGGSGILQIDSRKLHVTKGDLVVINPYESHATFSCQDGYSYQMVIINVTYLLRQLNSLEYTQSLQQYADGQIKICNRIPESTKILPSIDTVFAALMEQPEQRHLPVFSLVLYLLSALLEAYTECGTNLPLQDLQQQRLSLEPALQYIHQNFHTDTCRQGHLATMCGFEKSYFCKLFRKTLGVGLVEYIDRLKIYKADYLLVATDKKMAQIAAETGFRDVAYFFRWFKRTHGCTPSDYRIHFREREALTAGGNTANRNVQK